MSAGPPAARRVLVWDLLSYGHHERYLGEFVSGAPDGVELTLPHWTPPEIAARSDRAEILGPPAHADEWRSFSDAVEHVRPDVVVAMEAHRLVRWLATRKLRPFGFVALDLRDHHGVLGNPRAYVRALRPRLVAGALAAWLAREIVARRRPSRFLSLNGWTTRVGSRLLRDCAVALPDPFEHLPLPQLDERASATTTITIAGLMSERKGLDLLVAALEQLAAEERLDVENVEVVVAGQSLPAYTSTFRELVRRIERLGVRVRAEDRHLKVEELGAAFAATDVLVLAYRSHLGSSGFLSSAFDVPGITVVCSDFGWLGHIAGSAGALLFRDGSASGLAAALARALSERPALVPAANAIGFAEPEEFARHLWAAVAGV